MFVYKDREFNDGDLVKGTIKGIAFEGKLRIEDKFSFICTNNSRFDGRGASNKYGYLYSWCFFIRDGELTDSVIIDTDTYYKDSFYISNELLVILNAIDNKIVPLLKLKNILPKYTSFELGDKGLVKIKTDRNTNIDIKFGRLVRAIANESKTLELTDSDIEKYHNKYTLYTQSSVIKEEILKGDDILSAYDTRNYLQCISRLGRSCMNDKMKYLSIYKDNPDRISILIIKKYDKIVSRALIWLTDCGTKIIDKYYSSDDWADVMLNNIAKRDGYLSVYNIDDVDKKKYKVTLKNIDLDSEVPYIDSFRYLDQNNALNMLYSSDTLAMFDETNGTYRKNRY